MKITDLVIGDSVVHIAQPGRTGVVEGFTFRESRGYIACHRIVATHVRVRFEGHMALSYDPAVLRLSPFPRRFLVVWPGNGHSSAEVDVLFADTAQAAALLSVHQGTVDVIDADSGAHTRFRVSREPTATPIDTPEPSPASP